MQYCAASVLPVCPRCAGLVTVGDKAPDFVANDEALELGPPE